MTGVAILIPLLLGGGGTGQGLELLPGSRLWLSGTSTLRSFDCSVDQFELQVETISGEPVPAITIGQKAVTAAVLRVPAASLECGNTTMNKHMWKALRSSENPDIRFSLNYYDLVAAATGQTAILQGSLEMGGVTHSVTISTAVTGTGDGMLHVVGSHVLAMSEWGMKRPSLMLGTIRVGDEITVHFDLLLKG